MSTEVDFSEDVDLDSSKLDGGGGLNTSKLAEQLTAWGSCVPGTSQRYCPMTDLPSPPVPVGSRANTIFEAARQIGYYPEVSSVELTDCCGQVYWYRNASISTLGSFPYMSQAPQTLKCAPYCPNSSETRTRARHHCSP